MDMVRDISDWVIVMAQGKIVAEGPPESVMADPAVIDAYLGGHHDASLDAAPLEEVDPGHHYHRDADTGTTSKEADR